MPLILQLRERIAAFHNAKQAYLHDVRSVARNFADGLAAHVGGASYYHSVLIGKFEDTGFVETAVEDLGLEGKSLELALCLAIQQGAAGDAESIAFPMAISAEDGFYRLDLKNAGGIIEIPKATVLEGRFKVAYDMIMDHLMDLHDPSYFDAE